jgi:hypothetical protein
VTGFKAATAASPAVSPGAAAGYTVTVVVIGSGFGLAMMIVLSKAPFGAAVPPAQ